MKVWIPLGIFLFLAGGFTGGWLMNARHAEKILETQCRVIASQSASRMEEAVRVRLALVRQLRVEWFLQPFADPESFRRRVQPLLDQFPGFLAINWVDSRGVIRWVVPPGPNRAALGKDLHVHPTARETFVEAERTGQDQLTPPIALYQGGLGIAAYFPIREDERNMGYLNAVFRINPLVRRVLGPSVLQNYAVRITAGNRLLFSNGRHPLRGWETRIPAATVSVGTTNSKLYVFPIETAIPIKRQMAYLGLLFAGLLFAGAIAGLTRQALSAHERLRSSEERYRDIFETSMDAIYLTTPDGHFVDFNEAMVRLFRAGDRPELLRVDVENLYRDPTERHHFLELLERNGSVRDYPLRLRALDGTPLLVRASATMTASPRNEGEAVMIRGILHDETEAHKMREELVRIQRLESMSDLAGGVAHDFNNILAAIMANASMLELHLEDAEQRVYTERIQASVESASRLTGQLLEFARGSLRKTELVDLSALVNDTLLILERSVDPDIIVHRQLDEDLPPVEGDPGRLQQILLNLLVNARDALAEGGVITIRTARSCPPMDQTGGAIVSGRPTASTWIRMTVSDTGCGMDEATRKRIFEPFFTTKGRAKGTGLGLAVAYGVVRDHGGTIRVESAPGHGTTFDVFLPATTDTAAPTAGMASRAHQSRSATVLVVDDDEAVRCGLVAMLTSAGYRAVEAVDGVEALEVFRRDNASIDVVILDMTMPGPSGIETMKSLREVAAGIPIVLSTGYSEGVWDRETDAPEAFLQKPYGRDLLLTTIEKVLDQARHVE